MTRSNLGIVLIAAVLSACSGAPSATEKATETPAGPQLVGAFTLDVDAEGNATVTMVDTRLATTVAVGATANKVNLVTLGKGPCGPGLYCTQMRLQSLFAANDLRGATVVLTRLTNSPGVSVANSDPLPSHLAGTSASGGLGVWLFGNLEEAGAAGDSIDRTWQFDWTSGGISVAGKVFADVRGAAALVETSCTNGLDDDGDAGFDCNDGDCATDAACPAEWCGTNGRDEDWDGNADCADEDCTGHPKCAEVVCNDGHDSDGDGAYDCDDLDCAGDEVCAVPPPAPSGAGIQQDISFAGLLAGGWSVCYEDTYQGTGANPVDVINDCIGAHMLIGCGDVGSDTLTLAAADTKTLVTTEVPATATGHHVANGVAWYLTYDFSWGFAPEGAVLSRNECDGNYEGPDGHLRMCWHTVQSQMFGGFTCGGLTWDDEHRRVVMVHD